MDETEVQLQQIIWSIENIAIKQRSIERTLDIVCFAQLMTLGASSFLLARLIFGSLESTSSYLFMFCFAFSPYAFWFLCHVVTKESGWQKNKLKEPKQRQ